MILASATLNAKLSQAQSSAGAAQPAIAKPSSRIDKTANTVRIYPFPPSLLQQPLWKETPNFGGRCIISEYSAGQFRQLVSVLSSLRSRALNYRSSMPTRD